MDEELSDIYFLHQHPGWSWRDLQDAPVEVVRTLKRITLSENTQARKEAAKK